MESRKPFQSLWCWMFCSDTAASMNKELCNTWYFFQYLFELSRIMKNVLKYTSRRNMNRRSSKYEPQQFINFYLETFEIHPS